jgi:hypothetical protein
MVSRFAHLHPRARPDENYVPSRLRVDERYKTAVFSEGGIGIGSWHFLRTSYSQAFPKHD